MRFLWQKDATGGVKLGIPLVCVAGAVTLFSLSAIEPFVFLRRLGGVALLGATALFVVQLGRSIGWDNLSAGEVVCAIPPSVVRSRRLVMIQQCQVFKLKTRAPTGSRCGRLVYARWTPRLVSVAATDDERS